MTPLERLQGESANISNVGVKYFFSVTRRRTTNNRNYAGTVRDLCVYVDPMKLFGVHPRYQFEKIEGVLHSHIAVRDNKIFLVYEAPSEIIFTRPGAYHWCVSANAFAMHREDEQMSSPNRRFW